jgi:hypothetical protein
MNLGSHQAHPDKQIRPGRLPCSRSCGRKHGSAISLLLLVLGPTLACAAELQPKTLAAWNHYIGQATARMNSRLDAGRHFLWVDEDPDRARRVRSSEILVVPVNGNGRTTVPDGLIHDWMGAAFFPDTTMEKVFATMAEYAHYKDFYKPTVIDSQLLSRDGTESRFSMRLLKRAFFVTAVMDADFKADYRRRDEKSRYGFMWSTRIQEVANYGEPSELKLAPGTGSGYIWRLFSISRFEERDGGVYVEMEAMALSRSVPSCLRWLMNPFVDRVSQSSLITSLGQTRQAVGSMQQSGALDLCSCKTGALSPQCVHPGQIMRAGRLWGVTHRPPTKRCRRAATTPTSAANACTWSQACPRAVECAGLRLALHSVSSTCSGSGPVISRSFSNRAS